MLKICSFKLAGLVFLLLTCSLVELFGQADIPSGIKVFTRFGSGMVVNKHHRDAYSIGVGIERQMSRHWWFRAEGGLDWGKYQTSDIERFILERSSLDPYTRSITASVSALHLWPLGAAQKHHVGLGFGVSGRLMQWQSVTEYSVLNRFDRASSSQDLISSTVQQQEANMASLLLGVHYKWNITKRLGIGAFIRYDLNAYQAHSTPLLTELRVNDAGQPVGLTNSWQSYFDGPRAVTTGLEVRLHF